MSEHNQQTGQVLFNDNRMGAEFDSSRTYRYKLWRRWDTGKPWIAFIMLNPSTADETENDPTIRRCINYAKEWGYGGLLVGNLFALRATDPGELENRPNPIGPENDAYLRSITTEAEKIIVAWGTKGSLMNRGREVVAMLDETLYALETTKEGHPNHPLYQPADAEPEVFTYE